MSRPVPARCTVEHWIKDYPELEFNGVKLRCNICKSILSWNVKTRIVEHLNSEKHKCNVSGNMTSSERHKHFNADLLRMMVECNIPLNKLNNPGFRHFLQNCVGGKYSNVKVPAESTLRRNYLPPVYEETKTRIMSEVEDKHIWISIDETMDACGRNIANILVGGMDEGTAMPARLLYSKILEQVDVDTVCQCVDESLKTLWGENYETYKGRVLLFISDAATYMKHAGQRFRQTYCNAVHVTCLARGLHTVAEAIRDCYPKIDKLIVNVKKIFWKAPARVDLFQDGLPGVPLPPEPVLTRCGTWLEAASYYYVHFDGLKIFIQQLNASDSVCISHAQKILTDPNTYTDLEYIHFNFSRIPLTIQRLEFVPIAPDYSLNKALSFVFDLRNFVFQLSSPSAEQVKNKISAVLQDNPGFVTLCRVVDLLEGKEVNFSESDVNVPSLKHFKYFKYAPVTSVDVERSFSNVKWIFCDKHSLSPEHLQQLLVIQSYCGTSE